MMMEQQQQQQQQAVESCVPPGFRFHPTEEELVGYYLARKQQVASHKMDIIQELDLYRIEPWDLQERCEQQTEWYFFSYKDRKYPSGTRTNRATAAGFWKATGRDKPVLSARSSRVIGMRKTLVFYKGRAPNGRKTDWIMHEYRLLQDNEHAPPAPQEEGWVVCRAFQKPTPNQRPCFFPSSSSSSSYSSYCGYDPNARLPGAVDDRYNYLQQQQQQQPSAGLHDANNISFYSDDDDLLSESKTKHLFSPIPPLESPTTATAIACASQQQRTTAESELAVIQQGGQAAAGAIDWSFLDALLSTTSQLDPATSPLFY